MTTIRGFDDFADDLLDLTADFDEAESLIQSAVMRGIRRAAGRLEGMMKRKAPVDTGTLRASIGWSETAPLTAEVGPTVEYAPYVEFGRGPVTPTEADALRFEVNGQTVFAQRVGPAAPQPFVRPAAKRGEDIVTEEIAQSVNEMLEEVL